MTEAYLASLKSCRRLQMRRQRRMLRLLAAAALMFVFGIYLVGTFGPGLGIGIIESRSDMSARIRKEVLGRVPPRTGFWSASRTLQREGRYVEVREHDECLSDDGTRVLSYPIALVCLWESRPTSFFHPRYTASAVIVAQDGKVGYVLVDVEYQCL